MIFLLRTAHLAEEMSGIEMFLRCCLSAFHASFLALNEHEQLCLVISQQRSEFTGVIILVEY